MVSTISFSFQERSRLDMRLFVLKEKNLARLTEGEKSSSSGRTLHLVRGGDGCFKRAEILERASGRIRIFHVDEGDVEEESDIVLWHLPKELDEEAFPRMACEVIVIGLLPQGIHCYCVVHFKSPWIPF